MPSTAVVFERACALSEKDSKVIIKVWQLFKNKIESFSDKFIKNRKRMTDLGHSLFC
jgi:hypothetical protein